MYNNYKCIIYNNDMLHKVWIVFAGLEKFSSIASL